MSRIIEKYWPDSVVEHGGVTRTVTAWAADIGYTPAGLARILSRSDDFSKVLIPELERRYNEPYEVAKRARKDVAKRARVAAVALSSVQRPVVLVLSRGPGLLTSVVSTLPFEPGVRLLAGRF